MAVPQVVADDRRKENTAIAAQTVFAFDFPVDLESELLVTKVELVTGFVTNPAIISSDLGARTITIAAQAVGDLILIEGVQILERKSNYLDGGDIAPQDVNFDFNNLVKSAQENRRDIDRAAVLSKDTLDSVDATLPAPVADAGLAWNPTADGFVNIAGLGPNAASATGTLTPEFPIVGNGGKDVKTAALGAVVIDVDDKVLIQDDDDADRMKTILVQDILDLAAGAGGVGPNLQSAKVNEAGGINKGQIVVISDVQGSQIRASLADNTDFDKSRVVALANEDGDNNDIIDFILLGVLTGTSGEPLDTSSFNEGDNLYLGTGGDPVNVHPSGTDAVILVGICTRSHPSLGSMAIRIDSHTIIEEFDGIMRHQLVNLSTGTAAVSAYTMVDSDGHFASWSLRGPNHAQGEGVALFYEGFGNIAYINNGNHDHVWLTDPSDSHSQVNLEEKMRLKADGELRLLSSAPSLFLEQEGGTADENKWELEAASDTLKLVLWNDAEGSSTSLMVVTRTAEVPDLVSIASDVLVVGDLTADNLTGGWSKVLKPNAHDGLIATAPNGAELSRENYETDSGNTQHNQKFALKFDTVVQEFFCASIPLPAGYTSGAITYRYQLTQSGVGTGGAQFVFKTAIMDAGGDLDNPTWSASNNINIAMPGALHEVVLMEFTQTPGNASSGSGNVLLISGKRNIGAGFDDFGADVHMLEVEISQ